MRNGLIQVTLIAMLTVGCVSQRYCDQSVAQLVEPLRTLSLQERRWNTIDARALSSAGLVTHERYGGAIVSMAEPKTRPVACSCCSTFYLRDGRLAELVIIRASTSAATLDDEIAGVLDAVAPATPPLVDEIQDTGMLYQRDIQWDMDGGAVYHLHIQKRQQSDKKWQLRISVARSGD